MANGNHPYTVIWYDAYDRSLEIAFVPYALDANEAVIYAVEKIKECKRSVDEIQVVCVVYGNMTARAMIEWDDRFVFFPKEDSEFGKGR